MKIGILLPCHNRPQYLAETLWSLERVKLPDGTQIMLIDDASTDKSVVDMLWNFKHPTAQVFVDDSCYNSGIKKVLLRGYDELFSGGCTHVINFDSDAIIHPDCVNELIELYIAGLDGGLLTAFHSTTKSANGDERHKVITQNEYFYLKESVGGINFCVDKEAYEKHIKPSLLPEFGNWDHMACISADGAYCLKQSRVQHIGFDSTLGHTENPDTADTFYYYDLPTVTLIGVDSNPERLQIAADKCTPNIRYGAVKLLSPEIRSKEQYSEFCCKELYKHVDTSHMLIFQHDGYVHNWKAWDNDWLQYDYIGAPWHYTDGMDVGNGGFSLRSRALMEAVSKIAVDMHPEDHHICRTYRKALELMGFKFAPVEVAEQFAFEGYRQPDKHLTTQFGKHGDRPEPAKKPVKARYIIGQQQGLGDILFLVPLVRALTAEGNEMLWPVVKHYLPIKKHFPDLNMVDMDTVPINYDSMIRYKTPYGEWLPYRFASNILKKPLTQCMQTKYSLYGHDYKMWRQLTWKRDRVAETALKELLNLPEKYVVVNENFGEPQRGAKAVIEYTGDLPIVNMSAIDGCTLIDWLGVIEGAQEIHVANSSINYLLELMPNLPPVHLYPRGVWGEVGFAYTEALWESGKFIYH